MSEIILNSFSFKEKKCKKIVTTIAIFLTLHTPLLADVEYYRFTADIYDQTDVIPKLSKGKELSKSDIKLLEDELLRRKEKQLENNCFRKIIQNIEDLKKELSKINDAAFKKIILKDFIDLESTVASATIGATVGIVAVSGVVTAGATVLVAAAAAGVAVLATKIISALRDKNAAPLIQTTPQTIIGEMRELEKKYRDLKAGLHTEPVVEIEKSYIQQKKVMNKSLQNQVEESLIQSRVNDYFFQLNIPAIKYALGIALKPKALLDEGNWQDSEDQLRRNFDADSSFSVYSGEIKEKLLQTILHVAKASMVDDMGLSLRRVEHWFGSGSTGKSTAAKRIARFLGLPFFEKRIINSDEITMENVFGSSRSIQGAPTLGWLAEALSRQTGGRSYENAFLILDDFPVNTESAQSILLDITDSKKKSIFNNYLQTHLNTSRLSMLIISNENFRSLKPQGEPDPTFDALTTRFTSIEFPEFDEDQKRQVVLPFLKETFGKKHLLPFFYGFLYVDSMQFDLTYDAEALRYMGIAQPPVITINVANEFMTTREVKDKFERVLIEKGNELGSQRNRYYNEYIQTQNPQALKDAALRGHLKAMNMLVKETQAGSTLEEKKRIFKWFAGKHISSRNINAAKELWVELFALNDWSIWPDVSKDLSSSEIKAEDKPILAHLVRFAENCHTIDGASQYVLEIGEYLYKISQIATDAGDKSRYSAAAKNIGRLLYQEHKTTSNRDLKKNYLKFAIKLQVPQEEAMAFLTRNTPSINHSSIISSVQNLSKFSETVGMLRSNRSVVQLGGFDRLFTTNEGEIKNLWTTNSGWTNFCNWWRRKPTDDSTLLHRIERFSNENDKKIVSKFHIDVVQSIGEYLLGFSDTLQGKLKDAAGKDTIARANIKTFVEHIQFLFQSTALYVEEADKPALIDLHKDLKDRYDLIDQFEADNGRVPR